MFWLGLAGIGTGLMGLFLILMASYKYGQGLVPGMNRYVWGSLGFLVATIIILIVLLIARG